MPNLPSVSPVQEKRIVRNTINNQPLERGAEAASKATPVSSVYPSRARGLQDRAGLPTESPYTRTAMLSGPQHCVQRVALVPRAKTPSADAIDPTFHE